MMRLTFDGRGERRVAYLEKSAQSALLGRGTKAAPRDLLRLRRRLASPYFASRPLLIGSQWVFLEMSPGLNSGKVARQNDLEVSFLRTVPDYRVLRAPGHVMKAEIATVLRGAPLKIFLPKGFRLPLNDADTWREDYRLLQNMHRQFVEFQTDAKAGVETEWPGFEKKLEVSQWFSKPRRGYIVATWTRGMLERTRKELELPRDKSRWPDPALLPTAWCRAAFNAAYAYKVNYANLAIRPNDFLDGCHYAAGAHADDFVTADRRLIGILEECPPPKPNVIQFDDWLDRVLSTRALEAPAVS